MWYLGIEDILKVIIECLRFYFIILVKLDGIWKLLVIYCFSSISYCYFVGYVISFFGMEDVLY